MNRIHLFILGIVLMVITGSFVMHPLKVSNTTITQKDQFIRLKIRLFSDDLSQSMSRVFKKTVSYEKENLSQVEQDSLIKYISTNFQLKLDGNKVDLQLEGILTDQSNVDFFVTEIKLKSKNKLNLNRSTSISVKNTLLFDATPEQKNMVNVIDFFDEDFSLIFNNGEADFKSKKR